MLVDSENLTRSGVKSILVRRPDFRLVAECADGAGAVELVEEHRPDIVLVNPHLRDCDGVEVITEMLHADAPGLRVVVLTGCEHKSCLYRSLRAGVSGYLLKTDDEAEILRAVGVVALGFAIICPRMTRKLLDEFDVIVPVEPDCYPEVFSALSGRELQVLGGIAQGKSNGEIAHELNLTGATVKSHVSHVLAKLDIRDRVQAALLAYKSGLASRARRG
ncbi:response regulator transcription factor [Amycolatopsis sp. H6(2020)]|nr:response regulator transcription factor [Amycolatopsis sp. H6(2020)]